MLPLCAFLSSREVCKKLDSKALSVLPRKIVVWAPVQRDLLKRPPLFVNWRRAYGLRWVFSQNLAPPMMYGFPEGRHSSVAELKMSDYWQFDVWKNLAWQKMNSYCPFQWESFAVTLPMLQIFYAYFRRLWIYIGEPFCHKKPSIASLSTTKNIWVHPKCLPFFKNFPCSIKDILIGVWGWRILLWY